MAILNSTETGTLASSGDFHREERTLGSSAVPPSRQKALLLHEKGQRYELSNDYAVPEIQSDEEVLIKVQYIGLNPIDWKSADYGFGIPSFPYIAGRDLVGTIVQCPHPSPNSSVPSPLRQVRVGDVVFTASTDYRDQRKSAFQHFAIASCSNISRVPKSVPRVNVAGIGVAFVAAVLAMGVCFGCDFGTVATRQANSEDDEMGPNLRQILHHDVQPEVLSADVRDECLHGIEEGQEPKKGEWILIWGGSSTTAQIVAQLAKMVGLRVILVVDVGKHGEKLSVGDKGLLVDCHDEDRAVAIVKSVTKGTLRFAVDAVGKSTAQVAQNCLRQNEEDDRSISHLVGLSGLPKETVPGIKHHNVPVKVFHEVPKVGGRIMRWLEGLLKDGMLTLPETDVVVGGIECINKALDTMRRGEVSGKRLVIKV
ncbi:quinone oxidoreductase [Aulographum hederae CBS 113979]|uniref:Quinone oxidoreductase n=1 Tax=Aulographum hederae CBS 113979 TaxID=1176131 RepID=A0A6G1H3E5_9PEZI|nr:quinone oxidoreductase [Aulographum hederae CBS 113979]